MGDTGMAVIQGSFGIPAPPWHALATYAARKSPRDLATVAPKTLPASLAGAGRLLHVSNPKP